MGEMKKILLSAATVVAFVVYALFQKGGQPAGIAPASAATTPTTSSSTVSSTAVAASGGFKDGTYVGSPENASYGTVQVQAVMKGGKITDVQFLSYPSDRRTSQQINSRAIPILQQETIAAQSANVNAVTGATFTSEAFVASLQSALAQAGA
jgi:uncharacterized protein with FMN-binding domain